MWLTVDHVTQYRYAAPVRGAVQSHRLTPSICDGQRVQSWDVNVSGGQKGGGFRDGAGDWVQGWTVQGPVSEVTVTVRGVIETFDLAGMLKGHRESVPPMAYLASTAATRADAELAGLSMAARKPGEPLSTAHAMCDAVADAIVYTPGATRAHTTASEALALGEGVCQDHAHALIAMARAARMPARYVSGYLLAEGAAQDASHAWAEIWVEGLGWIGFDPANRCCPDARYVRLGSGLDAQDAAPIRGIARGPGAEEMDVTVHVTAGQSQNQQ